jgi:hypothetical protein
VVAIGNIEHLQPIVLSLTHNPLDTAAAATIGRLCQAGWSVTWDGGTCGDVCAILPETCLTF